MSWRSWLFPNSPGVQAENSERSANGEHIGVRENELAGPLPVLAQLSLFAHGGHVVARIGLWSEGASASFWERYAGRNIAAYRGPPLQFCPTGRMRPDTGCQCGAAPLYNGSMVANMGIWVTRPKNPIISMAASGKSAMMDEARAAA
jgi:hypothetical protein